MTDVGPASRGFSSDLTALIRCGKGPFFVKAMRNRPGGRRESLVREALVNPAVKPVAPALLWQVENEGWIALGFDVVEGRRADFGPGSPDLPAVVDTLNRISALNPPEVARDWPETRWDRFARDKAEADLFRGEALLHTDINPSNLIVGQDRMWAVDWAWPTRGAAFIDVACLVVQLIAAGHTAQGAESWTAHCPAWRNANPAAIDAFATATFRMYRSQASRFPDASWLDDMVTAVRAWAVHRGVAPRPPSPAQAGCDGCSSDADADADADDLGLGAAER
ncbi:phosphotransferase [Streptomyces sp. NPDC056697]|uniref:phosphotransferase n=1 Tax=Streptomyces sp. NPDC056697 TaxID=3345915 RepID=UPI0036C1EC29